MDDSLYTGARLVHFTMDREFDGCPVIAESPTVAVEIQPPDLFCVCGQQPAFIFPSTADEHVICTWNLRRHVA
jgi:hypothetical protein